ncbi:MAG: hypothetical protein MHMPM18_002023 [Marteilia pararefringens]
MKKIRKLGDTYIEKNCELELKVILHHIDSFISDLDKQHSIAIQKLNEEINAKNKTIHHLESINEQLEYKLEDTKLELSEMMRENKEIVEKCKSSAKITEIKLSNNKNDVARLEGENSELRAKLKSKDSSSNVGSIKDINESSILTCKTGENVEPRIPNRRQIIDDFCKSEELKGRKLIDLIEQRISEISNFNKKC